eukprot:scaffold5203_cov105-Pinguiococcus_pyrenoidosus.AAC.1
MGRVPLESPGDQLMCALRSFRPRRCCLRSLASPTHSTSYALMAAATATSRTSLSSATRSSS